MLLLVSGVIACSSPARCQGESAPAVRAATAGDAGEGFLSREVLPNGLTLIVHPNSTSNVVGMEIISRIGTRYEPPEHAGLANLTLRVMIEGAGSRSGEAIRTWFEDWGASLSAMAHPDYSEIGAAIMAPEFPEMASILSSLIGHAELSAQGFHTAREMTLGQLRSPVQNSAAAAEAATYQSLRTLLADGTAYGRPEVGLASTVAALTPEEVTRFYHAMFAPRETIVCVSGNVKAGEALRLLRGLFSDLPRQPQAVSPPAIRTVVKEPSSMVLAGEGNEAWIMVGYLTPGVREPEYPALSVLNAIIGGSNAAILPSRFRNQNGVYDSGTFVQPFAFQSHIVGYVRAEPLLWDQQQQKVHPVIDDFRERLLGVFRSVGEHGVTLQQVQTAREFVMGQYLLAHERNRSYAGYLGWYEGIGMGAQFDQHFLEEVRKVTPEQVSKLARAYFQPSQEATVVMFPHPRVEESQ